MNLPQLAQDKANHLLYGQLIWGVSAFVMMKLGFGYNEAYRYALWITIFLGGGKELVDKILNLIANMRGKPAPHGVELYDAMATIFGGMSVWLAVKVL